MQERGFLEEVARGAGEVLLQHLGRLERVEKKGARDLVTRADREAEAQVLAALRARHPADPVLAEESRPEVRRQGRLWVVDPLDGTTNFVYGIPHFAVSIALLVDGRPVEACVYNPALDTCFTASAGGGAWCGGRRLACRREGRLSEALLATGFAYRKEELADTNLRHFTDLALRARGMRRLGSAALDLCYVAMGRYDGFWELHLQPWDVAAGGLVAQEAGARVCDLAGGDDWLFGGQVVAANPQLNAVVREVLAAADPDALPGPRHPRPGGQ